MFHGPCHGIGLGRCPGPPSLNSADATSDGSRGRTDAHSFVDAFDREIELVSIGSQPFIGRVRSAVEIMATDLAVISLTDLAAGLVGSVPDDIVTSGDTIFLAIGIRTRNIRELPFWSSFSHLIHRMGYGLLNISKYQIIMGTLPYDLSDEQIGKTTTAMTTDPIREPNTIKCNIRARSAHPEDHHGVQCPQDPRWSRNL